MDNSLPQLFSILCGELCNLLYIKDYNKTKINSLIDELNTKPYKTQFFVRKHSINKDKVRYKGGLIPQGIVFTCIKRSLADATTLLTALCLNIRPEDELLCSKTSHLINSLLTRQNFQFDIGYLNKAISWHIQCLGKCSEITLPDILHNMQCILQFYPQVGPKYIDQLIGCQGILNKLIDSETLKSQNPLQICVIALKCIISLFSTDDSKSEFIQVEIKENISQIVIKFLMMGTSNSQDEFLYCKAVISALRVLSQLYFNDVNIKIPLPEVMGLCLHFIVYGLVEQDTKPSKIMPAQQTIAVTPVVAKNLKGGKKQKLRKQRNSAIESLKKEIPVSDRSLMKDVGSFENNAAYKPASTSYLEPQKSRALAALTSDSDVSDVESGREAKLIALKSRVRQSAGNLLLVLIKVRESKEIFGYYWALFPDSPNAEHWDAGEGAKKTLAYCAVTDPIASSRASVLSVILALLAGSRPYLSQAETSKKEQASFIPFSVTLGYVITCMHKVLTSILDKERSQTVIIAALKCCAALVQATPYHKMKEGLISELVRPTRKFLIDRDKTLQVGALITMGCVISIDPKVDEVLKAIEKDPHCIKPLQKEKPTVIISEECDDFEEGYSDDEIFTAIQDEEKDFKPVVVHNKMIGERHFKSWILERCFRNLGWVFAADELVKVKPAIIPIMLESLQVLSAVAFHYFPNLLHPHISLLGDVLSEMLQFDHLDVVTQAATTVSVIGDAIQKLEQSNQWPPLNQCVYMWEKLLTPLSSVLQSHENASAKAVVCDCIANIGEKSFKELPRHLQVLCCTLLMGSCSDEEPLVRAAAVRALAMTVLYRTLREDIGFVSDCGENILRALGETTQIVRVKAAWALGTLSDALVINLEEPDIDNIDDDLLLRLLEVSIQCASDNDKVKMSATRGLGNLLRVVKKDNLARNTQLKPLCETAIDKLLACACKVTNMKVRWNACYALGNAMKNDNLFTCFNGWQQKVFHNLCQLTQECKNLKVRINAAAALRAPSHRDQYGVHFPAVWRGIMGAMENAANVDDFSEFKHKDNLIEQLCVTLAHLCCLLKQSDLPEILDPMVFHFDCAKSLFNQLCHKLLPENVSCVKILQAAKYVTVDLTADNDSESQTLGMLQDIFIWDL